MSPSGPQNAFQAHLSSLSNEFEAGLAGHKYPKLIEELNKCENRGLWDDNKIIDSNGRYSYGGLMFQMETFLQMGKKYGYFPDWVKEDDVKDLIYQRYMQTLIAEEMIQDGIGPTPGGWYWCWIYKNLDQYK